MKVIKESFMKWLDEQIMALSLLPDTTVTHEDTIRRDTLLEVKEKLQQTINEEFEKLNHA